MQQFPGASTVANANIKVSGNTPRPDFVRASGSYPYAHNIYFETPDTAVAKLNFLKQLGMEGVILWEMSNEVWDDGKSIVKGLYKASGNPSTRPALPAPSFATTAGNSTGNGPVASENLESSDNLIWSNDAKLPNDSGPYGMTGAPALAVFNNKLYCVHRGGGRGNDSSYLFITQFDGSSWTGDDQLKTQDGGFVGAGDAPVLAVYNNVLWCVHPGTGDGASRLWFTTTADGKSWTKDKQLTTSGNAVGINGAPALAVYHNTLWCVYRGASAGRGDQLYFIKYEPAKNDWIDPTLALIQAPPGQNSIKIGGSPALAVYNDLLYCVFQGSGSANNSSLWYATTDGGTYWTDRGQIKTLTSGLNKAGTLNGIVGSVDTPALVVNNNFFYCIHRGGNSGKDSGYLWITAGLNSPDSDFAKKAGFWRRDIQLMTGEAPQTGPFISGSKQSGSGVVGALGTPALAVYNNRLYCIHPGGGNSNDRGYLWFTTNPPPGSPAPASNPVWVEAKGANSFRYYKLDNAAAGGGAITENKTVTIDSGVPFLYAALTKSTEAIDFPSGATLKITGPDNKTYSAAQDDDQVYAAAGGNSLKALLIKNPAPGDYKVALTVPQNASFHFELAALPSKDIGQTIHDALANVVPDQTNPGKGTQLQTSGGPGPGKLPSFLNPRDVAGMAAVIYYAFTERLASRAPLVEVFVSEATGGALTTADFSSAAASTPTATPTPSMSTPTNLATASATLAFDVPRTGALRVGLPRVRFRVATWNVYPRNLNRPDLPGVLPTPLARMQAMITAGGQHHVAIIAFQEVPPALIADMQANRAGGIWQTIQATNRNYGTNYDIVFVNTEYPPYDPRNLRAPRPATQGQQGYAIAYDQNIVTRITAPTFFEPQNFVNGIEQARPPVETQFRINGVNIPFFFYTWHAEATQSLARDSVAAFDRSVDPNARWILAGDLNVQRNGLTTAIPTLASTEGNNQFLHHYDNSLDYIVSDQTVGNFVRDDDLEDSARFWNELTSDGNHIALFAYITFN